MPILDDTAANLPIRTNVGNTIRFSARLKDGAGNVLSIAELGFSSFIVALATAPAPSQSFFTVSYSLPANTVTFLLPNAVVTGMNGRYSYRIAATAGGGVTLFRYILRGVIEVIPV